MRALSLEGAAEHLWMLVPGLLVVYLGFDAGGFFAGTTGAATAGLAGLAAVRFLTAPRSRLRPTAAGVLTIVGLGGYAGLSLLSQHWSHSPARALLSFDLAALYFALALQCSGLRLTASLLRTMICGLIAALAAVCAAGLLTRTLPLSFPIGSALQTPRVSYPLTYWNALGMAAALGFLLALHIAGDRESHPGARLAASALTPVFAATLLLTLSRGAILALVVGLVIYAALGLRFSLLMSAVAIGPFVAIAARVTYNAAALVSSLPTSDKAISEGHHVAGTVGLCMAGACLTAGVMLLLQRRLPTGPPRRSRVVALIAGAIITVAVAVLALNSQAFLHREYHAFLNAPASSSGSPARDRLGSVSNNGRVELWRAAVHGFDAQPLHGLGAGTFQLLWQRRRTRYEPVLETHSLYLQTLAELGVLGAVALAIFLLGLVAGAVRLLWSPADRTIAALGLAMLVAWALHSGLDWDWQVPAITAPVVAVVGAVGACARVRPDRASGAAVAAGAEPAAGARAARARRGVVPAIRGVCAAGCVGLGIAPALVGVSQAHLDAAVRAFDRHDCATAMREAGAAHSAVGSRPEPLEVLGYCQARSATPRRAITTMRAAVKRDPADWEFRYALAIATAASGRNPLGILHRAARLDRHEPLLSGALTAFRRETRAERRRTALRLPLDIPQE